MEALLNDFTGDWNSPDDVLGALQYVLDEIKHGRQFSTGELSTLAHNAAYANVWFERDPRENVDMSVAHILTTLQLVYRRGDLADFTAVYVRVLADRIHTALSRHQPGAQTALSELRSSRLVTLDDTSNPWKLQFRGELTLLEWDNNEMFLV